jgi:hypothetical protein
MTDVFQHYNIPIVDDDGVKKWYVDGVLHRTDGAAIECVDGTKFWYTHGYLHRADGPAIECPDGREYWYYNGIVHRNIGPAITENEGRTKRWYRYGVLVHSENYVKSSVCRRIFNAIFKIKTHQK